MAKKTFLKQTKTNLFFIKSDFKIKVNISVLCVLYLDFNLFLFSVKSNSNLSHERFSEFQCWNLDISGGCILF